MALALIFSHSNTCVSEFSLFRVIEDRILMIKAEDPTCNNEEEDFVIGKNSEKEGKEGKQGEKEIK